MVTQISVCVNSGYEGSFRKGCCCEDSYCDCGWERHGGFGCDFDLQYHARNITAVDSITLNSCTANKSSETAGMADRGINKSER